MHGRWCENLPADADTVVASEIRMDAEFDGFRRSGQKFETDLGTKPSGKPNLSALRQVRSLRLEVTAFFDAANAILPQCPSPTHPVPQVVGRSDG